MKSIEIERQQTNVEVLDAEIRASLGQAFLGISSKPGWITLYFAEDVTGTQMQAARDLASLHDPEGLSPRQIAEAARRQVIADGRVSYRAPIEPRQFDGESDVIKGLAERVAWLEAELRDLRAL